MLTDSGKKKATRGRSASYQDFDLKSLEFPAHHLLQDLPKASASQKDPAEETTLEIEYEDSQNRDPDASTPTVVKYVRAEVGENKDEDHNERCEEEQGSEDEEVEPQEEGQRPKVQPEEKAVVPKDEPKEEEKISEKVSDNKPLKRLASKMKVEPSAKKPKGDTQPKEESPEELKDPPPEPVRESMIDLMAGCVGSPDSDMEKPRRKKRVKPAQVETKPVLKKGKPLKSEDPPAEPVSPPHVLDSDDENENVSLKESLSCAVSSFGFACRKRSPW